ncbi:MAG TPA: ATP-binding protein [Thermoanaerobaculia bacterium]|nr:ATP-binding protein [Thermoanaerobaculia bacterium]
MPAAPFPANEEERLRALADFDILDTKPEHAFDDVAQLAAAICGTPIALISFVDRDRQWFKARIGMERTETPRTEAFCAYAIHDAAVLEVPDATADVRFSDNPLVTRDPHIRFYAGAPVTTADGLHLGTVCALDTIARTLSEQQRSALAALARQVSVLLQHRYRMHVMSTLVDRSPVAIYAKDENGRYFYANQVFETLSRVNAIGRTSTEIFGDSIGKLLDAADRALLAGGDGSHAADVAVYGAGSEWLTTRFVITRLNGAPAIAAIGVDVTDIAEATGRATEADRQRLDLIESMPAVIWERWYREDGTLSSSFVSPYIRPLLGYTEEEWLSADDFWKRAVDPTDRAALETSLRDALFPRSLLCQLITRDGKRIWAEMTSSGESVPHRTRTVIIDATDSINARLRREIDDRIYTEFSTLNNELATMQRTLVQQRNDLRDMNEEKNRFIGMAAHDLRNPLGAILMFTEVLIRKTAPRLDDQETAVIRRIESVTRKMSAIVNGFLDVARIESGNLGLNLETTDLTRLVSTVVELQTPLAAQKDIELVFAAADAVPVTIDVGKIEQVVTNLLTNAIKFSPPGTAVTINVAAREHAAEISVTDQGPGITAELAPQLFTSFARGSAKPTAGEASVGLGLAICKRIVEGHAGQIRIESTPGQGATFYVELPAR